MPLFNALIRTHHITSRKKIAALRKAFAAQPDLRLVLLRVGSPPGMIYVEGSSEDGVASWVKAMNLLRYKDFRVVCRPTRLPDQRVEDGRAGARERERHTEEETTREFREVGTVSEFAEVMARRGLRSWWMQGIGYEQGDA